MRNTEYTNLTHTMLMYRRMASMLASGVGLRESVKALADAGGKTGTAKLLRKINSEIEGGASTAQALRDNLSHLRGFTNNIFERDEKELSGIFRNISELVGRGKSLRDLSQGALVYPVTITSIAFLVVMVILIFVVPVFKDMFGAMVGQLPLPTQVVIKASGFLTSALPVVVLAIITFIVLCRVNRNFYFMFVDKIPFLRRMGRKLAAAEFMITYSLLSNLGISTPEALKAASLGISNGFLARRLGAIAEDSSDVKAHMSEMSRVGFFDDITRQMLEVGERTGTFESACAEIAPVIFDEAEIETRRFMSSMEPIFMLILGTAIGYIVIALYLPIFRLITLI